MTEPNYPNSLAEVPSYEEMAKLTGLETMEAVISGDLPAAPISRVMNFKMHKVEYGIVTFRGAPKFEHFNPMGTVHGGWYGTLLDSALGCSVASILDKGHRYTTLEYKVNLVRGLKEGTLVDCTAKVQHSGRSTAVASAEVRGVEDGKLYATGSTTCIIFPV